MHLFVASKLSNFLRSQPHFASASLGYSAAPGLRRLPDACLTGRPQKNADKADAIGLPPFGGARSHPQGLGREFNRHCEEHRKPECVAYDAGIQSFDGSAHLREGNMRGCSHCGSQLGLIVYRNWVLRFCSKACKKAYEHKVEEERRAKHRHLAFLADATLWPDIPAPSPAAI